MPRMVILKHVFPEPDADIPGAKDRIAQDGIRKSANHWDLMLEHPSESTLMTWALESPPEAGLQISATQIANHRLKYLEYEGPISNDRGSVARIFESSFEWGEFTKQRIVIRLDSERFSKIEILLQSESNWSVQFSKA